MNWIENRLRQTRERLGNVGEYEVIESQVNLEGRPVANTLLETLTSSRSPIRGVVFFGEPGSSKTTALMQLHKHIKKHFRPTELFSHVLEYDYILEETEKRARTDRRYWDREQVAVFSARLFNAVAGALDHVAKMRKTGIAGREPWVVLVDMVGVGREEKWARPALEALANREDILFLGLVPHPKVQRRAEHIRRDFRNLTKKFGAELNAIEILRVLTKHKVVLGADTLVQLQEPENFEMFRKILARMGGPIAIKFISQEVLDEASSWQERGLIDPEQVKLPAPIEKSIHPASRPLYRLRVAHMQRYIREVLNLSPDQGKVVLTPFLRSGIHWYVDLKHPRL